LKDIKVAVVLRLAFNVSLLVESQLLFNVVLRSLVEHYLVRGAHLKEAAAGVVVTAPDTFDNCLYFWSLD
jgi:hypothetical protein